MQVLMELETHSDLESELTAKLKSEAPPAGMPENMPLTNRLDVLSLEQGVWAIRNGNEWVQVFAIHFRNQKGDIMIQVHSQRFWGLWRKHKSRIYALGFCVFKAGENWYLKQAKRLDFKAILDEAKYQPHCDCNSGRVSYERKYVNGSRHYFLQCANCDKIGKSAIPKKSLKYVA